MKAKKALKNTAFYGLVIPTAAVVDTLLTATGHLAGTVIATARAPYASYKGMKTARKILAETR